MKPMRKLMQVGLLLSAMAGVAYAATVPQVSSSPVNNEPSQIVAMFNTLVASINSAIGGQVAALPAPVTTTGTSANTILQYTNVLLPTAGNVLHLKMWGTTNTTSTNTVTATMTFGASGSVALVVGGASNKVFFVDYYIQNVGTHASPVWQAVGAGYGNAAYVAPVAGSGTDQIDTSPMTAKLQMTVATSGDATVNGAYIEYVK